MAFGLDLSSDSESTVYDTQTGSQSESGGASAVNIGPVNKTGSVSISVTNSQTDQGAISAALNYAGEVAAGLSRSVSDLVGASTAATQSNQYLTERFLDSGERVLVGAAGFVGDALSDILAHGELQIAAVNNAVDGANSIARDALFQAGTIVNLAEDLNSQNTYFLQDVNRQNSLLVGSVVERVTDSTGDVINTIADLEESRMIESGQVIKTIKELAEVVQTGGESIQQNVNKMVVVAVVAVAGIIAWRALA